MGQECEHDFHVRRAQAELDLAYRAGGHPAMAAHFRLSALHMRRAQALAGPSNCPCERSSRPAASERVKESIGRPTRAVIPA